MAKKKRPDKPPTLAEFVLARRRAGCRVCQLPIEIRAEIKSARTKKIHRPVMLEWLQQAHGIRLTGADLDAHYSGRHENGYQA